MRSYCGPTKPTEWSTSGPPAGATPAGNPPPESVDSQTSIVAALRARLTAKDAQIAELKAAVRERDEIIAALRGELEKRIAAAPG